LAGVTRQVGDALLLERSQRSGRVISIGIAPWGIVENNHELCGHNRDVPYHSISSPRYRTCTYCLCLLCASKYTLSSWERCKHCLEKILTESCCYC